MKSTLPAWMSLGQAAEWLTDKTEVAELRWTQQSLLATLCTNIGPLSDLHQLLPLWLLVPGGEFDLVTERDPVRHINEPYIPITHETAQLFYVHPSIDSGAVKVRVDGDPAASLSPGKNVSRNWLAVQGLDLIMFLHAWGHVQKDIQARLTGQQAEETPPAAAAAAHENVPATDVEATGDSQTTPGESGLLQTAVAGSRSGKPRDTPLSAEILEAVRRAPKPDNLHSVWGELSKLAENRFGILCGFSSDGLQYRGKRFDETGEPDVFTRKNLRDRIQGAQRRAKARRDAPRRV